MNYVLVILSEAKNLRGRQGTRANILGSSLRSE